MSADLSARTVSRTEGVDGVRAESTAVLVVSRDNRRGSADRHIGGHTQGSPISPLLANVALDVLDMAWATNHRRLGTLVRYADDLVILCANEERAETARTQVAAILEPLGLRLHPEKTRMVHLGGGAGGFDFLGFHHRLRLSHRWKGRWYLLRWPSSRAMSSVRSKVRSLTTHNYASLPMEAVVDRLNPVLPGWGAYLRHGNSSERFSDRLLREPAAGAACQSQARAPRLELDYPV